MGGVVAYDYDWFFGVFISPLFPFEAGDNTAYVTWQSHSLSRQLASGEHRRSMKEFFFDRAIRECY